jgi:hypothetical protein
MNSQAIVFERTGTADDIGISLSSFESRLESLLSIMQSRTPVLAEASERYAQNLLQQKYSNPTEAVVASYALLRSGSSQLNRSWLNNLAADFNYADAFLILGKLVSETTESLGNMLGDRVFENMNPGIRTELNSADDRRMRSILVAECIRQAFAKAPYPLLTEGFRILQELLHMLQGDAKAGTGGGNFEMAQDALRTVGLARIEQQVQLFEQIDWKSRYTTIALPAGSPPPSLLTPS